MKLILCFLTELKKFTWNSWFLFSVIAAATLSFFAVIYEDLWTKTAYTVWDMLMTYSKDELVSFGASLSSYEVFFKGSSQAQSMLLPILASLPFAIPMALERRTGSLRYSLIRCGTRCFCGANLLSAMTAGGFVMSLGAVLFGLAAAAFFPNPAAFDLTLNAQHVNAILQHLAGQFLTGCGASLLAYLLAFLTTNYYLIVCVPFLTEFLAERTADWAFSHYVFSYEIYENWFTCLLPTRLYGVPWASPMSLVCLAVYILLAVLILLIVIGITERRADRAA